MARRKRKPQEPSLAFGMVQPLPSVSSPSEASVETRDNSEALGDDNMPDIVRSKDLRAIAARGDQLRRLGKALPLCWLPGDPTTFKDTNG